MKITAAILGGAATAAAFLPSNVLTPPELVADELDFSGGKSAHGALAARATKVGTGTFAQLVDHNNASQGTFAQRFWWNTEFWTGPGAPVVFFTPGETAADNYTGYLTNATITGQFAQALGAAVVMLEHRYWGGSSPYQALTTKNLRFLTLANSIADTTRFARKAQLPFDRNGTSNAPAAPWVMSGGSYAGALAAWVQQRDPGTFWAYHASSAVVEAVEDFWQYFEPVREGMPQNCSLDVQRVVAHVDTVLETGSDADVQALKDRFGLGSIKQSDDFVAAIENGPWTWQNHDFYSGYSSFYRFCDYVENAVTGVFNRSCQAGPNGVGLKKALDGYARWTKDVMLPGYCAKTGYYKDRLSTECFDTYNASSPQFTDITVANDIDRQWNWLLCNEPFAFWQNGAPQGVPTLVSRLVNTAYWERQCALFFPTDAEGYTYGLAAGKTVDAVNAYTGGWDAVNTTRLIWANGEFDPWKHATVSSDFRTGGPLASTAQAPVHVIPGGIHCSDLIYSNAEANAQVKAVVEAEVATIKGWVAEFYSKKRAVPFRA